MKEEVALKVELVLVEAVVVEVVVVTPSPNAIARSPKAKNAIGIPRILRW